MNLVHDSKTSSQGVSGSGSKKQNLNINVSSSIKKPYSRDLIKASSKSSFAGQLIKQTPQSTKTAVSILYPSGH